MQLVTIEAFSRVIDARLAQARLEGAGIRAYLMDESVASIDPFLINAIGGVKLQVEAVDEEAARELLSQPLGDAVADDVDETAPHCPRCDSEYVFSTRSSPAKSRDQPGTDRMKCRRCDYEGDGIEFAPKRRGRPLEPTSQANGKHAHLGRPVTDRPPVFRLERRHGVLGGVIGLAAGLVATVVFPHELGAVGFAVGTIAGVVIGRSRTYAVCSDPTCRGRVGRDDLTCPRCKGNLRGKITREGDHFVRVAEWKREQARAPSFDA
jgi:hypothetical protein